VLHNCNSKLQLGSFLLIISKLELGVTLFIMKIKLFIIVLIAFIFQACPPQRKMLSSLEKARFENEIEAFEQQDRENGMDTKEILFVGSSSIRMWTTLKEDMQPLKVLNRGFGGATTPEVQYFYNRIITPYKPRIVVVYVGENDIAEGKKPLEVYYAVQSLFRQIKSDFKKTKIVYLSMKPSIARWEMWENFKQGNVAIKTMCEDNDDYYYLETASVMLNPDGSIRKDIFIKDGLHMNAKGYEDWTNMVKPLLEELK
jgi:lysophospholipase L1-like esterase